MFPALQLFQAYSDLGRQAVEYAFDAAQRQILFADAMRKRGNLYIEHGLQGKPPLLKFQHELLIDGHTLERPCNYNLLRIVPDSKHPSNPAKRPIIIVDPRAGHGPGIGGFKPDSQVGMAVRAGHPVYFIAFEPQPVKGQTLADVGAAEAIFIEHVSALHTLSQRKPAIIGNCQAGWAVAALAAMRPEIMGPILLNGAPLSFWAGSAEENPMRYLSGVLGGSWLASFSADLGRGQFDGSHLVRNFESLNPANTYWTKHYNLYAHIDDEESRYLEFERWWGGYFRMTGEEIESITENLFIGNKLARGTVKIGDTAIDLRNIAAPVVIFASRGDNITPPSQALNWILDVWGDERAIVHAGRTIVYTVHQSIGHLGIFVGGGVAKKEHDQMLHTLEQIEALPPGLYELVLEARSSSVKYDALGYGDYSVKFKPRTTDDILAIDLDGRDDELVFSTIAKISEWNAAMYKTWLRPLVQAGVSEPLAELMTNVSPDRIARILSSDANPAMKALAVVAQRVRESRVPPLDARNAFATLERRGAKAIEESLEAYRKVRDDNVAHWVEWFYGPQMLGALFPPEALAEGEARAHAAKEVESARSELHDRVAVGGFPEGLMRMLLIAFHDKGSIRRRSLRLAQIAANVVDDLATKGTLKKIKQPIDWKSIRDEQATLLAVLPEESIAALPELIWDERERALASAIVGRVMLVDPEAANLGSDLVQKVQQLLGVEIETAAMAEDLPLELLAIGAMQSA